MRAEQQALRLVRPQRDHAVVLNGTTVSGGTVTGLSVLMNGFSVSGTATAASTFHPLGFYEGGQSISGSAKLVGDIEFRGQGFSKSSGTYFGFVDSSINAAGNTTDVTQAKPYSWRPESAGFRLVGCVVLAIGPERRDLA